MKSAINVLDVCLGWFGGDFFDRSCCGCTFRQAACIKLSSFLLLVIFSISRTITIKRSKQRGKIHFHLNYKILIKT